MYYGRELLSAAGRFGKKPAILFKGRTITFDELAADTMRLANALAALGVRKGDRVATYLPNGPDFALAYTSVLTLGAVIVPIHYGARNELPVCLNHAGAKLLLTVREANADYAALRAAVPSLTRIVFCEEELRGLMDAASSEPPPDPGCSEDDPCSVFYTTGSTGRPKGVLWRLRHLDSAPMALRDFLGVDDRDVALCAVPLSHTGGLVYLQECVSLGTTVVMLPSFSPPHFIEAAQAHGVTCFHIVPAMLQALLRVPHIEAKTLPSVRWVAVFGAPSAPEQVALFKKVCPNAALLSGYGLTETAPPTTLPPIDRLRPASVGMAMPWGGMAILDAAGDELPPGETGEIAFRGWAVAEYYKDPEMTRSVMSGEWFRTGDIGRTDADGYLYISGRKKEAIIVGGLNVYADEVEFVLAGHPAVKEAAVVGVADAKRGEHVKAVVVLKEGAAATAKDLTAHCRQHLANFKVPHVVEFRDALPRVGIGKVAKELLK
jgi:acyl-CoA synthetase (AMP-forming)/AMP-acid ligase II